MRCRMIVYSVLCALLSSTAAHAQESSSKPRLSEAGTMAVFMCVMSVGKMLPEVCHEVVRQEREGPVLHGRPGETPRQFCDRAFANPNSSQSMACQMRAIVLETPRDDGTPFSTELSQ